jgi:hypothetical protein
LSHPSVDGQVLFTSIPQLRFAHWGLFTFCPFGAKTYSIMAQTKNLVSDEIE